MKLACAALAILATSVLHAQTVEPAPSIFRESVPLNSSRELKILMRQPDEIATVRPYDLIAIDIYHGPALNRIGRVEVDGTLALPLIGTLKIEGLTVAQAADMLAKVYRDRQLLTDPIVTVTVLESPSRMITVTGEVASPGLYPVIGSVSRKEATSASSASTPVYGIQTLSQLITAAGGLKDTASNILTLVRPSLPEPLTIVLSSDPARDEYANLRVLAGDQLRVAHIGAAYIIGAVKKQGAIQLKNFSPTSVAQAIAMSDGIGYEASANNAELVRTEGSKRIFFNVPVDKILQGKAVDITLQNDDILYIPTSKTKAAIKGGATGFIVSLASTYIYAHP